MSGFIDRLGEALAAKIIETAEGAPLDPAGDRRDNDKQAARIVANVARRLDDYVKEAGA